MTPAVLLGLTALLWAALITAACFAEALMGDVEWPRRRRRPRRRTSWADDPRSNAPSPDDIERSRRSTLPAPPEDP
jgi:peptidoglycan/LPS O-acetylase OafA/YrhL